MSAAAQKFTTVAHGAVVGEREIEDGAARTDTGLDTYLQTTTVWMSLD
jgi:hypothetical protein